METKQAYMLRDVDLKGDIYRYITKSIAPGFAENPANRKRLMESLDNIFEHANQSLPEKIRAGWEAEGERYLKERGQDLSP